MSEEYLKDRTGQEYLDASAADVLKAYRYFVKVGGQRDIVAVLLTIAWAVLMGRK